MTSACELSVLVPVLNGQEYLSKKVNNLRLNFGSNPGVEVIISVNKSDDDSEFMLREIEDLLPGNFKVWYQKEKLKLNDNFEFLLGQSHGKWVYFTAVDDLSCFGIPYPLNEHLAAFTQEIGVIGRWSYENEFHGKELIDVDLSGPIEKRIRNLQEKIRVSHGIFYCIIRKHVWIDFFKFFDSDIIGMDWLFELYMVTKGSLKTEICFETVFAVNGISRDRETFRKQGAKGIFLWFPYLKLIIQSSRIMLKTKGIKAKLAILGLIIYLLKGNIHRLVISIALNFKRFFNGNKGVVP